MITRLRLQGTDLYALDDKNDLVYSIKLSDDGKTPLRQEPISLMRIGAAHEGGYTIGQIVDIAFDDHSGDLAMLDRNGTLVRCSPQFILNCDAQRVLNANNWEGPKSLTIWARKLYILDSEAGQIWRYDPSGSSYVSAPREYFAGSARPNLRNVVDFTISQKGTVYVLYDDGIMKTYIGGNESPFVFSGFNEGSEPHVVHTDGFYLNDSPFAPGFFLTSRRTQTIFETTVAGTFMDSYQAFDQEKLELISAVVAYPEQNLVYVASGNNDILPQHGIGVVLRRQALPPARPRRLWWRLDTATTGGHPKQQRGGSLCELAAIAGIDGMSALIKPLLSVLYSLGSGGDPHGAHFRRGGVRATFTTSHQPPSVFKVFMETLHGASQFATVTEARFWVYLRTGYPQQSEAGAAWARRY